MNIILEYHCGTYLRCTIDHVLSDCDDTQTARLTKILFEKGSIDAQEALSVLRPRGEYHVGPDEPYYVDRKL